MTYIERIVVRLAADASQYNRVMDQASKKLMNTTAGFVRAGSSAGTAFAAAAARHAAQVRDLADRNAAAVARITGAAAARQSAVLAGQTAAMGRLSDAHARNVRNTTNSMLKQLDTVARKRRDTVESTRAALAANSAGRYDAVFRATEARNRESLAAVARFNDQKRQIQERFALRSKLINDRAAAGSLDPTDAKARISALRQMKNLSIRQARDRATTSQEAAEKTHQNTVTRIHADAIAKRTELVQKYHTNLKALSDQEARIRAAGGAKVGTLLADLRKQEAEVLARAAAARTRIAARESSQLTAAAKAHADQMRRLGPAPKFNLMQGSLIGNLAKMGGDKVGAGVTSATGSAGAGKIAGMVTQFGALGAAGAVVGGVLAGVTMAFGLATTASFALIGGLFEIGRGAAHAAVHIITLGAELERTRTQFQTMLGVTAGNTLLRQTQELAIRTPFKARDLTKSAAQMLGMGITAKQVIPALSRLGDIAAGDEEKLWRLSYAAAQVQAAGRFMGTELRQFTEAGVGVSDFARANNMETHEFQEKMRAGEIGPDAMWKGINALTSEGGRFFQSNEQQLRTAKGQWNSLTETIELAAATFGEAFIKQAGVADTLKSITGVISPLMDQAGSQVSNVVGMFNSFKTEIVGFGTDVANAFKLAFSGSGKDEFMAFFPTAGELARSLRGLMVDLFLGTLDLVLNLADPLWSAVAIMEFLYKVVSRNVIVMLRFGQAIWFTVGVLAKLASGHWSDALEISDPFGAMIDGLKTVESHLDGAVRRFGNLTDAAKITAGSVKDAWGKGPPVPGAAGAHAGAPFMPDGIFFDRQGNIVDRDKATFVNKDGKLDFIPNANLTEREQAERDQERVFGHRDHEAAGDLRWGDETPGLRDPIPFDKTLSPAVRSFMEDLKNRYSKVNPGVTFDRNKKFIEDAKGLLTDDQLDFAKREVFLENLEAGMAPGQLGFNRARNIIDDASIARGSGLLTNREVANPILKGINAAVNDLVEPSEQLSDAWNLVDRAMANMTITARDAAGVMGPLFDKLKKDNEDIASRSAGGTATQAMIDYIDNKNRQLAGFHKGGITEEQYALNLEGMRQKLQKELVGTVELPKAAFSGTAEAMDQINQIQNGQKDTLLSMEELLKRAEDRDKKKLEAAERAAKANEEALKNRVVVNGRGIK